MQKVMVIGSCGAGKSYFSKQLHALTNIPLYHLDKFYWKQNWTESTQEEFMKNIQEVMQRTQWIFDGNYNRTIAVRAAEADTIIFLDYSRWICMFRVIARYCMICLGSTKRDCISSNCKERLNWKFLKWVWQYPYYGRPSAIAQITASGFPIENVIFLRNQTETDAYLAGLMATNYN